MSAMDKKCKQIQSPTQPAAVLNAAAASFFHAGVTSSVFSPLFELLATSCSFGLPTTLSGDDCKSVWLCSSVSVSSVSLSIKSGLNFTKADSGPTGPKIFSQISRFQHLVLLWLKFLFLTDHGWCDPFSNFDFWSF